MQLVRGTIAEAGNLLQEEETGCVCQFIKVKNSGNEDTMERDVVEGSGRFLLRGNNSIAIPSVAPRGPDLFPEGRR